VNRIRLGRFTKKSHKKIKRLGCLEIVSNYREENMVGGVQKEE
jgi:hypothetical protein